MSFVCADINYRSPCRPQKLLIRNDFSYDIPLRVSLRDPTSAFLLHVRSLIMHLMQVLLTCTWSYALPFSLLSHLPPISHFILSISSFSSLPSHRHLLSSFSSIISPFCRFPLLSQSPLFRPSSHHMCFRACLIKILPSTLRLVYLDSACVIYAFTSVHRNNFLCTLYLLPLLPRFLLMH